MKGIKNVFILFVATVLFSCNKTEDKKSFITLPLISKSFTNGTWHITTIYKHNKDEKKIFDSCTFIFKDNNQIIVTEGSHTYSGIWKVTSDNGTDDSPAADIAFRISFQKGKLSELNEEWRIRERTLSKFGLFEDTDIKNCLVFQKNN